MNTADKKALKDANEYTKYLITILEELLEEKESLQDELTAALARIQELESGV